MIRILHSVSNMDRAGIETMLMNYYRHMDRSLVQFDFLCNKKKPGAYDEEIKALGGQIFHTPGLNPVRYVKYLVYMKALFAKHPYTIVEAHNGSLGIYALYAAKRNQIPARIYHAHGASITKDLKYPLKIFCKALLPYNMNYHFTCGKAAAEFYFRREVISAGDYELISNAIEVERFLYKEDTRQRMREKYGLTDKHVVGHVGRFMKQKNHGFLLEVFRVLKSKDPKAHLVLLGDGELLEEMQAKAEALGILDSVSFMGNVSDVHDWYQVFDCFVLPSKWEGLPVVGVEAQAADLPCIFSDSVTEEIGISDRATFLSLKERKHVWAEHIEQKFQISDRRDNYDLVTKRGFNISEEAIKLQSRYMEIYKECK